MAIVTVLHAKYTMKRMCKPRAYSPLNTNRQGFSNRYFSVFMYTFCLIKTKLLTLYTRYTVCMLHDVLGLWCFTFWLGNKLVPTPTHKAPLHFIWWITLVDCPMELQGWFTYVKYRVEKEVTAARIKKTTKKKKSQHATEKNPLVDRFDRFSAGTLHCLHYCFYITGRDIFALFCFFVFIDFFIVHRSQNVHYIYSGKVLVISVYFLNRIQLLFQQNTNKIVSHTFLKVFRILVE